MITVDSLLNSDADLRSFVRLYGHTFANVSPVERATYGLARLPGGWEWSAADTPRGPAVVLRCGSSARVLVYADDGSCPGAELYALADDDEHRYYAAQARPGGLAVRRVHSDDLDDTVPTAVVAGREGPTRVVELDQFYHKAGFLRVECSDDLPADLLAEMLLVGWSRVARRVDAVMAPGPDRATSA